MQAIQREAIAPKHDRSPLTHTDRQIIASVLTWDTQRDVLPEEVETIAIVHDIVWVKLTDNRAIPLHVETFRAIRHQQLEEQAQPDVEYVMELDAKLEAESRGDFTTGETPVDPELFKTTDEQIEIDSTEPGIYRVWKNMTFIGTVRRCKHTLCWIASSIYGTQQPYLTSAKAIAAVEREIGAL